MRNASYEQKDPLVIYKVESFHMFERMLANLNAKAVSTLMRGQVYIPEPRPQQEQPSAPEMSRAMPQQRAPRPNYRTSRGDFKTASATLPSEANAAAAAEAAQRAAAAQRQNEPQRTMPVKAGPRIGRNDPCPCGSGKKYKNCHGRNQ